jgi:hypothetical protein
MAIGGELLAGVSKLTAQPLGVVQAFFKGYDLGQTVEEATLVPDTNTKDIMYQQQGTKAADHVQTGEDYIVNLTFGEIKTSLLKLLKFGVLSTNVLPSEDHGDVSRKLYQSMRDNFAGALKVAECTAEGVPSEDEEDILNFYEAIPIVDGNLINWGADTQRNLKVAFRIKFHKFATGESATKSGSFGYWGDPTLEDLPPVTWPNVEAPTLLTAVVNSATELLATFDQNIAFQSAFAAANYIVDVEGEFSAPTNGVISGAGLTLTFGASTFTAGDVVKLSIGDVALQDTAGTPNKYDGISGFLCTNTLS